LFEVLVAELVCESISSFILGIDSLTDWYLKPAVSKTSLLQPQKSIVLYQRVHCCSLNVSTSQSDYIIPCATEPLLSLSMLFLEGATSMLAKWRLMASQLELIASLTDTHRRLLASLSSRTQEEEEGVLAYIATLREENHQLRGLLESRSRDFAAEADRLKQEARTQEERLQRSAEQALAVLETKAAAFLVVVPVESKKEVDSWTQERQERLKAREEVQLACITAQRELDLLKAGPLLTKERVVQALQQDLEGERRKLSQTQRLLEERASAEEAFRAELEQKAVEIVRLQQRVASDREVLFQQAQDLRRLRCDKDESKSQITSLQQALAQTRSELSAAQAHFSLLQAQYSALHTRVRGLRL